MEDTKSITVLIAGRPYPIKVKPDDEDAIRRVVRDMNETINRFQVTYQQKDKQDCLAIALLTYAVDLQKLRQSNNHKMLTDRIDDLDRTLTSLLGQ